MIFKVINYKGSQAIKLVKDNIYTPLLTEILDILDIHTDTLQNTNKRLSLHETKHNSMQEDISFIKSFICNVELISQMTITIVLLNYFISLI